MAKKPKAQPVIDLTELSVEELDKLAADIGKARIQLEKRRLKEARSALEKAAAEFGMSVSEVMGKAVSSKKSGGAAAPAKYANPANPAQTWSGRGRQPAWYKEAVAGGADPSSLEI